MRVAWRRRGAAATSYRARQLHSLEDMSRNPALVVLFVLAAALPSRLAHGGAHARTPGTPVADTSAPEIPGPVREAAKRGRFWRASRLLAEHLRAAADTAPTTILFASRLSAGWGDWASVSRLLEGRDWLDTVENGAGWSLLGRSRVREGRFAAAGEALSRYLSVAPGDSVAGVAELRRGLALTRAGETDAALSAFDSARALVPWFGDWASLFAARAAAGAGDTAQVEHRLRDVSSWLARDRGWRIRLDAATRADDNMLARRVALDAARAADASGDRAEAWSALGKLRLEGGDTARAREAFLNAMAGAPGTTGAVDAAWGLSGLNPSSGEWRRIGEIYLRHGNASRAAEAFGHFLDSGESAGADRLGVRLQLGRALFNGGHYPEAERLLLALAGTAAENAPVAAEALYLAGRAQYRQGRSTTGQKTFLRLAERYPDQEATARGLFLLADLKHDALELDEAKEYYRRAAAAAPDLYEAGLARMRLADLEIMDGSYAKAATIFENYLRSFPNGRRADQATYWAARMYERLGRDSLAEERLRALRRQDPLSFYGARAAELLGESVLGIPMSPEPPQSERADSLVRLALRRVDLLAALDLRDDLVREVSQLRRHFSGEISGEYALAEALNRRGYTLTGIAMGWDLRQREGQWNPRLLRIVYPFPFRNIVVPEAREQDLDPSLVAGLIRQESAFNPEISSGAGAIGLMQIMPSTGRGLARAAGLKDFETSLLKEPEVNVHLGVRFVKELMGRFNGQLPLVLSAYNAGPNRAVAWQKLPEHVDLELLSERIPYSETRDYIRRVLLHRALYRALYPDIEGGPGEPVEASAD